jgi:hypothetical protein
MYRRCPPLRASDSVRWLMLLKRTRLALSRFRSQARWRVDRAICVLTTGAHFGSSKPSGIFLGPLGTVGTKVSKFLSLSVCLCVSVQSHDCTFFHRTHQVHHQASLKHTLYPRQLFSPMFQPKVTLKKAHACDICFPLVIEYVRTRISQRNPRRIFISSPSSQRRDHHESRRSQPSDDATPEDGRFLVRGPPQVSDRGAPEAGGHTGHCDTRFSFMGS